MSLTARWFIPGSRHIVLGLGLNCTIGYGTLFYSFSLLSIELEQDFGWSKAFIFGVYSLGILFSGLAAPLFGKVLDHFGARLPMSIGSAIVALALFALSLVETKWQFIAALLVLEVAAILVLYESAFVALTQATGTQARLPITQITLMAGFASTIFWPLITWLLSLGDWRLVYQLMSAMHVLIALPIHWWVLKNLTKPITIKTPSYKSNENTTDDYNKPHDYLAEWVLSLCLGSSAFAIASLQIHLFRITQALTLPEQLALFAGVLIGPFQVIARFIEVTFGRRILPVQLGIISFLLMVLGIASLLWASIANPSIIMVAIVLFAALFGAGQGLSYIVRGALPLSLFGANNYGTITGRLNGVRMIMTAIAPVSFALLMDHLGVNTALNTLLILLTASTLGLGWLAQRQQMGESQSSLSS